MWKTIFLAVRYLWIHDRYFYLTLRKKLGFFPGKIEYYKQAFIHRSAGLKNSKGETISNERLEYLGDTVLNTIIADHFFHTYPNKSEGFLTKMRSRIVNREYLDHLFKTMGMKDLFISGIHKSATVKHVYGNAFEALIGAVYLDQGYNKTKSFFINRIIKKVIDLKYIESVDKDYKSHIIEWSQKHGSEIHFRTEEYSQDANKNMIYISYAEMNGKVYGEGRGLSKKEAEQNASEQALLKLGSHL